MWLTWRQARDRKVEKEGSPTCRPARRCYECLAMDNESMERNEVIVREGEREAMACLKVLMRLCFQYPVTLAQTTMRRGGPRVGGTGLVQKVQRILIRRVEEGISHGVQFEQTHCWQLVRFPYILQCFSRLYVVFPVALTLLERCN